MAKGQIIAGIDVGTDKICTVIASISPQTDKVNVIGVSSLPSSGLRKSQIVDIEEAIGAITESGEPILDQGIIKQYQIAEDYLKITIAKEQKEAARRLKLYRGEREPLNLKGQNVIIADDGIATGATMKAAIASVKGRGVKKITIAVPVSSVEASAEIKKLVDEFVCLDTPEYFGAVGAFYESFGQTTDEEVIKIMKNQVSRR